MAGSLIAPRSIKSSTQWKPRRSMRAPRFARPVPAWNSLSTQALSEAQIAPALRDVHIDHTLGRPDPVVFLGPARRPLDPAEVDAPHRATMRWRNILA